LTFIGALEISVCIKKQQQNSCQAKPAVVVSLNYLQCMALSDKKARLSPLLKTLNADLSAAVP
jgi:hypothetical protein